MSKSKTNSFSFYWHRKSSGQTISHFKRSTRISVDFFLLFAVQIPLRAEKQRSRNMDSPYRWYMCIKKTFSFDVLSRRAISKENVRESEKNVTLIAFYSRIVAASDR